MLHWVQRFPQLFIELISLQLARIIALACEKKIIYVFNLFV